MVLIFERAGGLQPVDGPAVAFSDTCAAGRPAGVRSLICPNPWSVLKYPRPDIRAETQLTQAIPTSNLHKLDWKTIDLPGAACGSSHPIRLRKQYGYFGAGIYPNVDFVWWNPVAVDPYPWPHPLVGNLDGDGPDEAATVVACSNGGGTADGQLAFSVVVFQASGRELNVLGILSPHAPLNPYLGHVPLVSLSTVGHRRIVVNETWYGAYDGTCCGSGRAKTVWTYEAGRLHPRTVFIHKPWASPVLVDDFYSSGPCGDTCQRAPLTAGLRFTVMLGNYGTALHNVRVTLTLQQQSRTLSETKTARKLTQTNDVKLVFGHFQHLRLGRARVTIDVHEPGAFPFRYRYLLTRPKH